MRIVCIKLCEVIDVYNIGISHALFLLVRYRSIVDRYLLMNKLINWMFRKDVII